jgi:hypothetical protein
MATVSCPPLEGQPKEDPDFQRSPGFPDQIGAMKGKGSLVQHSKHYGKTELCRALKRSPERFFSSARQNATLPCVFFYGLYAREITFVVHHFFTHGKLADRYHPLLPLPTYFFRTFCRA